MKHTTTLLATLFLLAVYVLPLAAQEDESEAEAAGDSPAEAEESPNPPAPRWDMRAELAFTDQSGSRSLQVFTGGFNASHRRREDFRFDIGVQSRYGRSNGEMVTRNDRLDIAFDLTPDEAWSPFLFADGERDPMRQLELRLNGGAGAKYTAARRSGRLGGALHLHGSPALHGAQDSPGGHRRDHGTALPEPGPVEHAGARRTRGAARNRGNAPDVLPAGVGRSG